MKITKEVIEIAEELDVEPKVGMWVYNTAQKETGFITQVSPWRIAYTVKDSIINGAGLSSGVTIIIPTVDWLIEEAEKLANYFSITRDDNCISELEKWECCYHDTIDEVLFVVESSPWLTCAKALIKLRKK